MSDRQRPRRRQIRERTHLQSGLSIIPSLFTIGNIFSGCYSIISVLRGNFDHAAIAIGIGAVLDGLDGRIARLTKTVSDFGLELDSLADVVTFGVAPAILAFAWGMGAFEATKGATGIAKDVTQFGWFSTFAFVLCGALRLARFNMQSKKPPDTASKRFFVGLPIPAAAGVIASIVHFFKKPILDFGSALLWYFLVSVVALLMISTVRYYSFKEFDMKKPRPRWIFVAAGALIWAIIFYSESVLLSLAVVYVTSGPVFHLVRFVQRFFPGRVAPTEPVHGNIRT
jgi:CDP-diacylglycerol--serine O-phosphatidyltransferase